MLLGQIPQKVFCEHLQHHTYSGKKGQTQSYAVISLKYKNVMQWLILSLSSTRPNSGYTYGRKLVFELKHFLQSGATKK